MFKIGSDVFCTDAQVGKLTKVAIDPHTKRVTDLIIERGLLLKEDRVIPADVVENANDEQIHLSLSSHEMQNYPEYREAEFTVSDPDLLREMGYQPDQSVEWALRYGMTMAGMGPLYPQVKERVQQGISSERPVIGRGTRVVNASDTIGYIDHLLVNKENGQITHLVIRRGLLPFRAILPMNMVESISHDQVYVPATRSELQSLEKFTPRDDADILREVQGRLAAFSQLDLSQIKVSLADGIVQLAGPVADVLSKRQAHKIAESVKGVLGIENSIMTDTEVEARVVSALLSDPYTYLAVIETEVDKGVVTLKGTIDSEEGKIVAERIAGEQPGVIKVKNELKVEAE